MSGIASCGGAVPPGLYYEDPLLHRLVPADDPDARFFWASGEDGTLRIESCMDCGYYVHPPTGYCPKCGGDRCEPTAVSGRGRIHTFTVNYQPWVENQKPYVIVLVELNEQSGLRLTSNLLECDTDDITVGLPVTVGFIARHGLWYPIFVPYDGEQS